MDRQRLMHIPVMDGTPLMIILYNMANLVDMKDLEIPKSLHHETPIFDLLDNTNYGVWRKNMRILLMRMCLIDLVDHDGPQDA